jgi:MT0933-like antitoxin protein
MGLLNAKNIAKAKDLALKNKEKLAPAITKATSAIDRKTGGKHTDKLKKLDDAAAKISGTAPPAADAGTPPPPNAAPTAPTPPTFDPPMPE